jgi:hypothetical protein
MSFTIEQSRKIMNKKSPKWFEGLLSSFFNNLIKLFENDVALKGIRKVWRLNLN